MGRQSESSHHRRHTLGDRSTAEFSQETNYSQQQKTMAWLGKTPKTLVFFMQLFGSSRKKFKKLAGNVKLSVQPKAH